MKVRLFGDSIRVRLTQSEVTSLADGGEIEVVLPVPPQALACSIRSMDDVLSVRHANGRMSIHVPSAECRRWAESTDEGLYGQQGGLRIAVEKDYRCLHKDNSPDNLGTFPNPASASKE